MERKVVTRRVWFERHFELGLPLDAFPDVLERVRGTPARIEERLRGLTSEVATQREGERWSIQENVGHLLDLEPLWSGRVEDLLAGRQEMRPADLENRKTHAADHNRRPLDELLVDLLCQCIKPPVNVIDVEGDKAGAHRGQADLLAEFVTHRLANEAGILESALEIQLVETVDLLTLNKPVDIELE